MMDGKPEADRQQPVHEAEQSAKGYSRSHGEPRIETRHHQQSRDDGGEIEHPADGKVDLADRQQKHHAQRQHALERGVSKHREKIDRIKKARFGETDHRDHDDQRDDDAGLFRQLEAMTAI